MCGRMTAIVSGVQHAREFTITDIESALVVAVV
jgi:hypothetical protein